MPTSPIAPPWPKCSPLLPAPRNDLDTPSAAALPELVERLARQRLADGLPDAAPGNGSNPAEHAPNPTGETGSSAPGVLGMREPVAPVPVSMNRALRR